MLNVFKVCLIEMKAILIELFNLRKLEGSFFSSKNHFGSIDFFDKWSLWYGFENDSLVKGEEILVNYLVVNLKTLRLFAFRPS